MSKKRLEPVQPPQNQYPQQPQGGQQYQQPYQQNPQYQQPPYPQAPYPQYPPFQPQPKKKHTARNILIGVAAVFAFLVIVAIGSGGEDKDNEETPEQETTQKEDVVSVAIDEHTVYEGHGVKIDVTGIEKTSRGYEVSFYFENNSTLNLGFNVHAYAVNGVMSKDGIYTMDTDVPAGKKSNNTLRVSDEWESFGEEKPVEYLDILFWAYDNDKYFKEFDTGVIRIETSAYHDDYTYKPEGGQSPTYQVNGIDVYPSINDEMRFSVMMVNNGEQYISFDMDSGSVNDWAYDLGIQVYDEFLFPGCTGVYEGKISSDFVEENSITSFDKFSFTLDIRPSGEYTESYSTDSIEVKK